MSSNKLSSAAEQYFSTLNPIASRIYADLRDTRNAYECLWDTLAFEEQSQILDECIIKPEATLKYSLEGEQASQPRSHWLTSGQFARKRIVEDCVAYRDEHSAPFSFRTLSQIDLRLFGSGGCEPMKAVMLTPKFEPPKLQQTKLTEDLFPEVPTTRYKTEPSLFEKLLGRRPSPDAEQEVLVSPENIHSDNSTLPKTGLDFLDNW